MLKRSWPVALALAGGLVLGSVGGVFAAQTFQGLPVVNVVVNGKPIKSDVPAVVLADRTLLPVRAVADALGLDVKWDENTQTVTLSTKSAAPTDAVYSDEYVSVSNVKVSKNSLGMTEVLLEVTSTNASKVTGLVTITFYDADGAITGTANGAVTDLAPGATKTVKLIATKDLTDYAKYKIQTDAMFTE